MACLLQLFGCCAFNTTVSLERKYEVQKTLGRIPTLGRPTINCEPVPPPSPKMVAEGIIEHQCQQNVPNLPNKQGTEIVLVQATNSKSMFSLVPPGGGKLGSQVPMEVATSNGSKVDTPRLIGEMRSNQSMSKSNDVKTQNTSNPQFMQIPSSVAREVSSRKSLSGEMTDEKEKRVMLKGILEMKKVTRVEESNVKHLDIRGNDKDGDLPDFMRHSICRERSSRQVLNDTPVMSAARSIRSIQPNK